MLWVRNLSVMELVLRMYVLFCVCVSLFTTSIVTVNATVLEADSNVVDMQVMCCS